MMNRMTKFLGQLVRLWRPAMTAAITLAAWNRCIEWKQPMEKEELSIARYVAAVQTVSGDLKAALRTGVPPTAGLGPTVNAPVPSPVLLGGTIQVTASAATPFTRLAVVVPGVNDYWELTLPAPTTSVAILIVFSQDIPKPVFQLQIGGASAAAFGGFQTSGISVINVGTGEVQVNISWNSRADVDLHVIDPSGAEIYWAGRQSPTGGQLDLDSNAGCGTDGPRAENIFWASGLIAPRGEYVIRTDYWSNCGAALTNYVVTVNVKGQPPQVFSGVFTGLGDGGGKGSGRNITATTY